MSILHLFQLVESNTYGIYANVTKSSGAVDRNKKNIFCLQESIWLLLYLFKKKETKEKITLLKMGYSKSRKKERFYTSKKRRKNAFILKDYPYLNEILINL